MAEIVEFEFIERGNGSVTIKRNVESIGTAARGTADQLSFFKQALATIGFTTVIRESVEMLDALTTMQNRLRAAGTSFESLNAVQTALLKTSNETRQSFTTTAALYSRLAINSRNLGLSQQDLIGFTKSVNQAIILSGANAQESSAGLIQFSQALASGTLRGDELRSVLEQMPVVADVIAQKLGVTRGALRELGAEGQISADIIIEAFKDAASSLDERFKTTVPTISQSFVILRNNATQMLSEMDKANGLVNIISSSVIFLSNNLAGLTATIIGVGVAGSAFYILTGGINSVTGALTKLQAAILANPILALTAALAGAAVAATLYSDKIDISTDGTVKLADALVLVKDGASNVASASLEATRELFGLDKAQKEAAASSSLLGSVMEAFITVAGMFPENMAAIRQQAQLRQEADATALSTQKSTRAYDALNKSVTKIIESYDDASTKTAKLAQVKNTLWQAVGVGLITQERMNQLLGAASGQIYKHKDAYADLLKTYDSVYTAQKTLVESMKIIEAARQSGRISSEEAARVEKLVTDSLQDSLAPQEALIRQYDQRASALKTISDAQAVLDAAVKREAMSQDEADTAIIKVTASLRDQLNPVDKLIQQYDSVFAAGMKLVDAQEVLDTEFAAGRISFEQYVETLEKVAKSLQDQLDPVGAIKRSMQEEIDLLGLDAQKREAQITVRNAVQNLQRSGITLTEEETKAISDLSSEMVKATDVARARDQIMEQTINKDREFITEIEQLKKVVSDFGLSYQETTAFVLQSNSSLFSGTYADLELLVSTYGDSLARIDALRQNDLISEQMAAAAKQKLDADITEKRLQGYSQMLGALASLTKSGNAKMFRIGQAAAIAQATVDGYAAIQKALASTAPPLSYALAAAMAVATGANIAQIASQQPPGFAFGGDFNVGGVGGTDSQTVAFRATPGERVRVTTPQQERDEANRESQGSSTQNGLKIINVLDPALVGDFLTTGAGEQVLINVIQRNADAVREVLQ